MKIKQNKFIKWKNNTLSNIIRFEPLGFNKWVGKEKKWKGRILTHEEAFYAWESMGIDAYDSCNNKKEFLNLVKRKDSMNLQINEWKKELQMISIFSKSMIDNYIYSYVVIESIVEEFGLDFVKKINLYPINQG